MVGSRMVGNSSVTPEHPQMHTIQAGAVTIPTGRHSSSREAARALKLRRMGFLSQSSGRGDRTPSVIHWHHTAILLDDTVPA